jgi:hypothetical protein
MNNCRQTVSCHGETACGPNGVHVLRCVPLCTAKGVSQPGESRTNS